MEETGIILRKNGEDSKTVASSIPTVLSLDNVDAVTNLYDISNTFNNYFASIAGTLQAA